MKFEAEKSQLVSALTRVTKAVESRNTIPILGNVLIKASGDTVSFTGTDLDIEITATEPMRVMQSGETTAPAALMLDIVKKLKDGSLVNVEVIDGFLHVKAGRSNLKLHVLPADDFPRISSTEYQSEFQADQTDIKKLFDQSAFAVSTEETRYYLNGVYFHSVDGKARTVATDGHRLALVDSEIREEFPSVIVPRKTVAIIRGVLDIGDCTIGVSETKVRIDCGNTVIVSKVIDGTFPDYNRVIPSDSGKSVRFSAQDARRAITLVSSVATDRTKAVAIDISSDGLGFEVAGATVGEGVEVIDSEMYGEPLRIGVNGKYALEALAQADNGGVSLEYTGSNCPMVVRYDAYPEMLCVIMPMRV